MDGFRKLGDIVDEYIITRGYDTRHNWDRLYTVAIRGLRNIWNDVSGIPTQEYIALDGLKTACTPKGMIKLIGLWVVTPRGKVVISPSESMNPIGTPTENYGINSQFLPDLGAAHYKNGEFIGGIYGGVGGNPLTYRIDYATNKIQFSSAVPQVVLCEYLKNPQLVDNAFYVHAYVEEPILKYLYWQDINYDRNVNRNEKEAARRDFYAAKQHAAMQFTSNNLEEMRTGWRKYYGQAPT